MNRKKAEHTTTTSLAGAEPLAARLRPHTLDEAERVVDIVENWQAVFLQALGHRMVDINRCWRFIVTVVNWFYDCLCRSKRIRALHFLSVKICAR